ncbi:MAG: LURP-one-related family protein [Kangiellaceae bacterium]|nr:LURP-one-related family protein [Kangiellaceae bacterium]MCW8997916.1 LURP-one-related family protein [Kangiellaceae bacterium]MCW9015723.1 LURP-one-related family protein [Kangiellaceae bacterium]
MIYRIKEKFWGFGDTFIITDDRGNDRCIVKGAAFSWGDKLSFQDTRGNELAYISQKLMSFKPRYRIYRGGNLFAEVTKEFSWFSKKFKLDVPGPNDYCIDGSFWKHDYTFNRDEGCVARVSKDFWGWTDSYGVEINDGEDDISILCACIVIDQILEDRKN